MSMWNKHSGTTSFGGPQGVGGGSSGGKQSSALSNFVRREPRTNISGEDGEIGEEEGEIIAGGGSGSGGVNDSINSSSDALPSYSSRQEQSGSTGLQRERGSLPLSVPRRHPPWSNTRGGGMGGRGIGPPYGRGGGGRGSISRQVQPPPALASSVPHKPEPMSRAQTFAGFATSRQSISNLNNTNEPSQQQSHQIPSALPGPVGFQSRNASTGTIPTSIARPTDPRFRGSDRIDSAGSRLPPISESSSAIGSASALPQPQSRGIPTQQQPPSHNYQASKDIGGLGTSRDIIRREVNRPSYNSLADMKDTDDSTTFQSSLRELPNFPRGSSGIASSEVDYAGGNDGGYTSPRRSTSRVMNSDSFSRDDDGPGSSFPPPLPTSRHPPLRNESNTFRGLADVADTSFGPRSLPAPPLPMRDSYRSSDLSASSSSLNDGTSYSSRPIRDSYRDRGAGLPHPSDVGPSDYGTDSISSAGHTSYSRGSTRDSFRGPIGRRSSDFRVNYSGDEVPFRSSSGISGSNEPSQSSLRGSASTDTTDSKYYGPHGSSNEFRRSPQPARRPTFGTGRDGGGPPPPPLGRTGSFVHRRNDPRFSSSISYDQESTSSIYSEGVPPPTTEEDVKKLSTTASLSLESTYSNFAKLADEPFSRSRDWMSNSSRRSPQSSPLGRSISSNYALSTSPNERSKLMAPSLASTGGPLPSVSVTQTDHSSASLVSEARASFVTLSSQENMTDQTGDPTSGPLTPAEEAPPPPLLSSDLGESNIRRGEKVIGEVADLLECFELKSPDPGGLSKLPSKQQILKAVALMDSKLKESQKAIDGKKAEIEFAVKEEEEMRVKAKEEAISEANRQEEERFRIAQEERIKEQQALEAEIETLIDVRTKEFAREKEKSMSELEEKLRAAIEVEEQKLKESLNQQIVITADNFDKDIVKVKKDLDKTKQSAFKTETKLANIEADYKAKLEEAEQSGSIDTHPRTEDLIANILAENKRRATEAHMFHFATVSSDSEESHIDALYEELENTKDPKEERTNAEWSQLTQQVKGLADALYTEPTEAPYFQHNERVHNLLEPIIAEYINDRDTMINQHWINLAEEYEYRRIEYEKMLPEREKHVMKSATLIERCTIIGNKPSEKVLESSGGRTSSNPYRRARRGNEVRSEYEQEQVIAELAEKEALQRRITHGGCQVPRQITQVERALSCIYVNSFNAQKVDVIEQERELALTNVWTDMEKCIFLDRFMQHPKDFRKIASFLRNKTTADCIQFYYDSKQSVPYKHALREHIMRRKRRGDYHVWDATVEAALSVGAHIEAGVNEEKPLVFMLPEDDLTYFTHDLHPIKLEMFDKIEIDNDALSDFEDALSDEEEQKIGKQRKRAREPLFVLDSSQRKFLKNQEPSPPVPKKTPMRPMIPDIDVAEEVVSVSTNLNIQSTDLHVSNSFVNIELEPKEEGGMTPGRKAPQKWTTEEKKIFIDTLAKHGRNWHMLSQAVGTKSISQIKNYYYDYKKQVGKGRADKKSLSRQDSTTPDINSKSSSLRSREEHVSSPQPPSSHASTPPETPAEPPRSVVENIATKGPVLDTRSVATDLKASTDMKAASGTRRASMDPKATDQKGRDPRAVDPRAIDQWTMEQRVLEQRAMEQRAIDSRATEQRTVEQRAMEQRSMEHRSMEQRNMDARASMEQRVMEQRALEKIMEQRIMEQRLMEQRGDVKVKPKPSYSWSQAGQQQFHVGPSDTRSATAMPPELTERSLPASGSTTPDPMTHSSDVWNQVQHQSLLQNQKMNEDAAARRLMQQHSHTQHHQQIISNILPWVSPAQQLPVGGSSGSGIHNWTDAQLQSFIRLQQQHHHQQQHRSQQQQQHHHLHSPNQPAAHQQPQQQQIPHHHNQHQQQQQTHHQRQQVHPQQHLHRQQQPHQHLHQQQRQSHQGQLSQQSTLASLASLTSLANPGILAALSQQPRTAADEAQLALAQHLLQLQGGSDGSSSNDAFGILARTLPNSGSNQKSFHGPGNPGNR